MNYLQLRVEVKRVTGRFDSQFDDRINMALMRAVRDWAREFPWESTELEGTITHRGGNMLVFPDDVERVVWLADKTNHAEVPVGSRQWDREEAYSYLSQTAGNALQWEPAGYVATMTPVTGYLESRYNGTALTTPSVYISGRYIYDETVGKQSELVASSTLGPTCITGVTTTRQFSWVDSIHVDARMPDPIEIRCAGTLVALIGPRNYESRYYRVRLLDAPPSGTEFVYRALQRPALLKDDYSAPPAGMNHDYLIWEAASDIFFQLKEDDRAIMAKRMADQIAKDYRQVETQFGDWSGRAIPEDLT